MFYTEEAHLDGKPLTKRGTSALVPEGIDVEWEQWLRGTRATPPTAAEIAALQQQRAAVRARAAAIDAEAALERLERQARAETDPHGPEQLGGGNFAPDSWRP